MASSTDGFVLLHRRLRATIRLQCSPPSSFQALVCWSMHQLVCSDDSPNRDTDSTSQRRARVVTRRTHIVLQTRMRANDKQICAHDIILHVFGNVCFFGAWHTLLDIHFCVYNTQHVISARSRMYLCNAFIMSQDNKNDIEVDSPANASLIITIEKWLLSSLTAGVYHKAKKCL